MIDLFDLNEAELDEVFGGCNSLNSCGHAAGAATAEAIEDAAAATQRFFNSLWSSWSSVC